MYYYYYATFCFLNSFSLVVLITTRTVLNICTHNTDFVPIDYLRYECFIIFV